MPFNVEILGKDALVTALETASDSLKASLQSAVGKSTAVLAKYTTAQTVPWKTGNLTQTFIADVGELWASWAPTASYAPFVEFGHSQQPGRYVPAIGKRLVASSVAAHPFMGKIAAAAQPEIDDLFYQALQLVVRDMSN
jgi:hypothetical protein